MDKWTGPLPLPVKSVTQPASKKELVALSHVRGTKENGSSLKPLIDVPIGQHFDELVSKYADKEVLRVIHQDVRLTWREFQEQVNALATGLLRLGLRPGDRIGTTFIHCI